MRHVHFGILVATSVLLWATTAVGQETNGGVVVSADTPRVVAAADSADPRAIRTQPAITIQHYRPQDRRGLNIFEPPKEPGVPYTGFKLDWGAAFTQQFQALDHENNAAPRVVNEIDQNALMDIGAGFNNATANLYLNAQLAPGIRVTLTTYLSSRHHNDAWVKDGYLLVDASPIDVDLLHSMMEYVTLRLGHFEINYGDAHFRRSDNGNAMYNPFVGNYIMDAFTTEIGGEVYVRKSGLLAMAGITGGELRGQVRQPDDRNWAYLAKLGFERQLAPELRVRLTGSLYTTDGSLSNTLYGGDRAGSRYYLVLENTQASESAQFTSGLINPGFRRQVTAVQLNPFLKLGGLELFGVLEQAEGRAATETADRTFKQYATDALYRFLDDDIYVGGRWNRVAGQLAGMTDDISVDRVALGAGWFITPSVLLKAEYVDQQYNHFPTTDIRSGGTFNGLMVEGVVSF